MTQVVGPATTDPDVIAVLLGQHARVKNLFAQVEAATGQARQERFDELRQLLAVHEIGEEIVLRPVAEKAAGEQEADARNAEEKEANKVLAELEKLDVDGAEFAAKFAEFQKAVLAHAEHEEREEFPAVREHCSPQERQEMGRRLLKAEDKAPTHPHASAAGSPTAQKVVGPFAAMVDKARDAL
ncbi:hemerythrin domain-containing protein [Streptacidiphilus sp. PB12-B1b]|uniref:hemerythrin domain-containing protein n=1 Tax=Streptacidiphilus sp. PB12-B1b TaxID=2705012 RepID=UPI0015F9003D|nr:hemerythrin domain-containing protein [Streptacidiphilus sp. PB12-B1b]QMU76715.1 hemerythrin domain-containing protein [Streptacidiphilus sp. PB12-B1b]